MFGFLSRVFLAAIGLILGLIGGLAIFSPPAALLRQSLTSLSIQGLMLRPPLSQPIGLGEGIYLIAGTVSVTAGIILIWKALAKRQQLSVVSLAPMAGGYHAQHETVRKLERAVGGKPAAERLMNLEIARGAKGWRQAAEWALDRLERDRR